MKPITKRLSLIGLLLTNSAFAADALQINVPAVISSADFRPSTAAETPVSLTEFDKETIEARGAQHLEEVLNLAPNVNVSSGASRGQYYQIRGMGERSQFTSPINPSVGLIIDGIDFSRSGGAATLFDIQSVEVLRGPQGTKFGANGLAGTINMRSTEPTKDFNMHVEAGGAEYNTRNLGIAAGGTLVEDKLLGRASIYTHKSDGFMDNQFLGRDNTSNQDELTFRGKLKLLATDDLTVDLSYIHLNIDNGYDAFTLANTRNSFADQPGEDKQRSNAVGIKANWNASDAVIIQSEATYLKSDLLYSYDDDWGNPIDRTDPTSSIYDPLGWGYNEADSYDRKRKNYSFELRALSDKAGRIFNDTTDWTIGLYHIDQDEAFIRDYTDNSKDFDGDYDTQNSSIYGQLDTRLTDKLTLVSGARVEYFKAKYIDSNNFDVSLHEFLFGGKVGLNYQANKDHFIYTSLSRGYKPGGANNGDDLTEDQLEFDTEYNITLEAGVKSNWLNDRLVTSLAAFYTKRRNAQVKNSITIPPTTPGGSPDFPDFTGNASNATHMGLEATADWFITDKVRLLGSLGLLNAEFDSHEFEEVSYDGRQVAHAPDYTFSLGGEFYPTSAWTLRANVEGKDGFYFSDSHNEKSGAYSIVNASADYRYNRNFKVSLWARNLFDKDYATRGFGFGNNPANKYAPGRYIQFGQPRVVGVTATFDY